MSIGPRELDPTILREYDVRGIVGDTLTKEDARAIACAFASLVIRAGGQRIVVGYDGRLSSPSIASAVVDGLVAAGASVIRIGLGPTPMLYFAVHELRADAGLIVTGSHNPVAYNGLKMTLRNKPLFGDAIRDLGRMVARGDFESGAGVVADHSVVEAYLSRLLMGLSIIRPLNVGWDPGHGSCAAILGELCKRLPGAHFLINNVVDGRFPAHHPDPSVDTNLAELRALVLERGCDLGIAFDGDGDRIGVIDGRGRVIQGDQLLIILAKAILEEKPGSTIIADVKSSQIFFDEIRRLGGVPLMARTGHSPMRALLAETGAPLAGDLSGHIFLAHRYYGFDDAMYASLRLLELASKSHLTVAEMRDGLPSAHNTPELRIYCDDQRKFGVIDEIKLRLRGEAVVELNEIDGVRVTLQDGWWMARASNTQPAIIGRCESRSPEGLAAMRASLARHLTASGIDASSV